MRNLLLPKNSVYPGNTEFALLRLNEDVVALLETIEVILVHGNMFKAAAVAPRGDDQAATARKRADGNLSDDRGGNADGARVVQLSVQKKEAGENPGHGNHAEIDSL